MKNSLILITLIISFSATLVLGAPDSLYYKANDCYQQGKYERAIDLYQSVVSNGYESSTLYYNLGNAFFRSNKLGKARLYYEKALKLDPSNEDIQANLLFVENLLVDKFEDLPELFIKRWIISLVKLLNSDQWGYISLVTFVFSFVSFLLYLLLRRLTIRKISFYSGFILIVISISSFLFSWKQRNFEVNPKSAIVIEYLVNVKSTPRETGTDLFVLHEGAKVWLEDLAADWREIRLSDGRKGWLPSTAIEEI